jgi:cytochrome c oxidase subunit 3
MNEPSSASLQALADARSRVGMWVFLGSEIMFFGPVFFAYLYGRYEWPSAFAAASGSTDLLCGTFNTAALLTSSAAVAMALRWAQNGAPRQAQRALEAAVLLAMLFLATKGYEYAQDWQEHRVPGAGFVLQGTINQMAAQLFYFVYFFATLLHGLHLLIGVGLLLYCGHELAHDPGGRATRRLEATGLYWHFVDIVWVFLYPALYLGGRT